MDTYNVQVWEKVSVWVYHNIDITTNIKPNKRNLRKLLDTCPTEYNQSDYEWSTQEHEKYDLNQDFVVERTYCG